MVRHVCQRVGGNSHKNAGPWASSWGQWSGLRQDTLSYHRESSSMPSGPLNCGGKIPYWTCFSNFFYHVIQKAASAEGGPEQDKAEHQVWAGGQAILLLGPHYPAHVCQTLTQNGDADRHVQVTPGQSRSGPGGQPSSGRSSERCPVMAPPGQRCSLRYGFILICGQ